MVLFYMTIKVHCHLRHRGRDVHHVNEGELTEQKVHWYMESSAHLDQMNQYNIPISANENRMAIL